VWAPLGPEPLKAFLDAYEAKDAGVAHDLLVLLNGFGSAEDLQPWRRLLRGVEHEELRLERPLLDLAAYREAVDRVRAERYCFLNSYSEPLVEGWLAKLEAALAQPRVALVGATGSWASNFSQMVHLMGLPSAYRGALPKRKATLEQFIALDVEEKGVEPPSPSRPLRSRLGDKVSAVREIPRQTLPYARFPNYHIRTNAFMIARETLNGLRWRDVRDKREAYLVENGRHSITRQLARDGLRTLVVDRFGVAYDRDQWHRSRTLWQGDQEGLMIADNQTRKYADADLDRRRLLSAFAWGRLAEPAPPNSTADSALVR